jgi:hypothetical protein
MASKSVPAIEWTCDGGCGLVKLVPEGFEPEGYHGEVKLLSNKTGKTKGTYWADKRGCVLKAIVNVTGGNEEPDEQENPNAEPTAVR